MLLKFAIQLNMFVTKTILIGLLKSRQVHISILGLIEYKRNKVLYNLVYAVAANDGNGYYVLTCDVHGKFSEIKQTSSLAEGWNLFTSEMEKLNLTLETSGTLVKA